MPQTTREFDLSKGEAESELKADFIGQQPVAE